MLWRYESPKSSQVFGLELKMRHLSQCQAKLCLIKWYST